MAASTASATPITPVVRIAPIGSLMLNPGPAVYYTDAFRRVLEDHMGFLRAHPATQLVPVSAQDSDWAFEHDLFGFLQSLGIAPQYHWVAMRMNNYTDPTEFGASASLLLLPPQNVIEQIRSAYMASSVMTA
ncbi:hypothetical protein HDG34_003297 [Paraburkholderia sp. HC6.4b]|uniref:hypothetical protein n=1 Tax=unclassified Paraburkholderia TaxID=2615204 RepID=UPI00161CAE73|nr:MULTISPECIES: hypothetical protein [unclassified Paraburkholderia]MBB5409356.1 hypothetical protein [Paraburkholderia sp. HC6.4b]MBB5451084.1 hypothetical protein [Paraburkholderia sp. Kb1A]